jgi:hypothetical protein
LSVLEKQQIVGQKERFQNKGGREMAKNHRKRLKNGGGHTTFIDAAKPLRDFLRKQPEVTSISAGRITGNIGPGPLWTKLKEMKGCIVATVRGGACLQEVRIYTKSFSKTAASIRDNFAIK